MSVGLTVEDCLAAITAHTHGLARAAGHNLTARIEHCPDWSMADLVWHLTSVHWFWNEVAARRPLTEPDDLVRPERPADDDLIGTLLAGVEVLTDTLRAADQQAACWTWGLEENVWFITRHQVQEAAVHHWDAVNAGAGTWSMDPVIAEDAVEEFLTHSVANRRWPVPDAEPLGTEFGVPGTAFRLRDGAMAGTLDWSRGEAGATDPAGALLWLYRRLPDDQMIDGGTNASVVARFRAYTATD